jgi:hypothetical protein
LFVLVFTCRLLLFSIASSSSTLFLLTI